MSSLGEVQRIIGLSLNKIQMGRNQRGGLPLHKNLLVATVLNKARDVYMQETMYMNYRLMACGQFNQEGSEDIEDEDTPETEDYEEDSESDVEDDGDNVKKDYVAQNIVPCLAAASSSHFNQTAQEHPAIEQPIPEEPVPVKTNNITPAATNSDEGFIDESDCDCDTRNFCQDSENRVPFQYCFSCAPFHPSNGRGPTLVSPQSTPTCVLPQPVTQEQEDKLIYDMDSKSTRNQSVQQSSSKRKRHISLEETQDAIISILPKKKKEEEEGDDLNDSGFQDENEVCILFIKTKSKLINLQIIYILLYKFINNFSYICFFQMFHPAFRGHTSNNGMEVEQITSLVSIFSFGQQLFNNADSSSNKQSSSSAKKSKDDEDSDSDSDTSSDSGHSSDDHENNTDDKAEEGTDGLRISDISSRVNSSDLRCSSQIKEGDLDVSAVGVAAAV